MGTHKFRIGETVTYRSRGVDAPKGEYVIIALLPRCEDGDFEIESNIRTRITKEAPRKAN
jgi:hypothetical protein